MKEVWILMATYDDGAPYIIGIHESHDGADNARRILEEINETVKYHGAKYTIKKYEVYP